MAKLYYASKTIEIMLLQDRIDACVQLGELLLVESPGRSIAMDKAKSENVWFDPINTRQAIQSLCTGFLNKQHLHHWVGQYSIIEQEPRLIGLVQAGNIPLVGFHDALAVFIAGHRNALKLSRKDTALWCFVLDTLYSIDNRTKEYFNIVEQLKDIDAVIATGSDNSSRYFEYYFGRYPHIFRKNRVGAAILTGQESKDELMALGSDVFQYYGLGCRNVSSLIVPRNYDFIPLLSLWESYTFLKDNSAYGNNYDYNYAIYLMSQIPFLANGAIIIIESDEMVSRLACLHYRYYSVESDIPLILSTSWSKIQTIVCHRPLPGLKVIPPGQTQCPGLNDYADGIDTMKFLLSL